MNKIVSRNSPKTCKFADLEVGEVFQVANSIGNEAYMKITSMTRINKITGAESIIRAVQLSNGYVYNFIDEENVVHQKAEIHIQHAD